MQEKRQGNGVRIAIGCGVLGVIGACLVCGGIMGLGAYNASQEAIREASGFFDDLRLHDFARAHARMSSSYRASHDVAAFQREVEAIPALAAHSAATLEERSRNNGRVTLEGHLDTASGPATVRVALTNELGSHWRIDAITLDQGGIGTEPAH